MPVRTKTIEEHGKRTISLQGNQTLTEALQALQDLQYSENETYLVVTLADAKYHVMLFADLKAILKKLGPDGLTQPLLRLPLAPASRIVPTDIEESGGDLLDWVASHPQAPVVVTDAGKFAALFINPNRSGDAGLADNLSLLGLQGELVKLSQDHRAGYVPKVQPPTCPHCHQANFYRTHLRSQEVAASRFSMSLTKQRFILVSA